MDGQSLPAPPADGVERETIPQQITRTYYALLPVFERHMGMSRARWHVLKRVFLEGQVSQARLQSHLGVDGAAITRQVKQLEAQGLISRAADPQDNRFTLVTLTPAGRELAEGLMLVRASFEAEVIAGMSEEDVAALRRGLTHVRANLAAMQAAAEE
jgi:DNA-binding MarR family transcriptional regulator